MKYLLPLCLITSGLISFQGFGQCFDEDLLDPKAICPANYDPVCGCDGVTYSNACQAVKYGGVTSHTKGECPANCLAIPSGVHFGACDMFLGYAWYQGGCTPFSGCNYVGSNGIDYSSAFSPSPEGCQPICEGCIDPSMIDLEVACIAVYDPVCGCDGITYSNSCVATYFGGVLSYSPGACPGAPLPCLDLSWVDFGECEMALGVSFNGFGCEYTSGCGYVVDGFDFSPFFFDDMETCTSQCQNYDPICVNSAFIDPEKACTAIWDPVCGCNGETYSNACVAFYQFGITSWESGECGGQGIGEESGLSFNLYPNPAANEVEILIPTNGRFTADIINTAGQLVQRLTLSGQTRHRIDLRGLPYGLYTISIQSENGLISHRKLLVE